MKNILLMILVIILASCTIKLPDHLSPNNMKKASLNMKSIKPLQRTKSLLSEPSKQKTINWEASLSPVVQKILTASGVDDNSVLLVNSIKNATNGNIQISKATAILAELIKKNCKKFQVISREKLNTARNAFGLSIEDSLESRSKALGIAHYLNAQYVLYSTICGDVKKPELNFQLILTRSGEIVWSGNGTIQN